MDAELEPMQKLLLWRLAVEPGGGMFLKDVPFKVTPAAKRKFLANNGLTVEEKRKDPDTGGRPVFVELTDKGWEWCQDHLADPIDARSPRVKDILSGLLQILSRFFQNQRHCPSLCDMLVQAKWTGVNPVHDEHEPDSQESATDNSGPASISPQTVADSEPQPVAPAEGGSLRHAIESACVQLTNGRHEVRVRLADLRNHLTGYERDDVDAELRNMEQAGLLRTWQLDNAAELTSADREAALVSAIGSEKHILYYGSTQS